MDTAKGRDSNDRFFCWEQVSRTNQAFKVSQVFAARDDAAKLLPLYALFSIVEQICSASFDEDLARTQLDWWRIECSQANMQSSHHPVLKEFRRTGAAQRILQDQLQSLFNSVQARLEARPLSDISELQAFCLGIQRPRFDLEISISGLSVDSLDARPGMLARGGLLQLFRESSKHPEQGAYWWIPLNLLARHGIGRDALVNEPESAKVTGLLSDLIAEVTAWAPSGHQISGDYNDLRALRHYFAINGIYYNKINRLKNKSPKHFNTEFNRFRVSDLFVAWQCARRLQC